MSASPTGLRPDDITVRDLLSSLTALRLLWMVMADCTNDEAILDLAVSAIPSLSHNCRAEAVLLDGAWQSVDCIRGHVGAPAGLEAKIATLGPAGGEIGAPDTGWAWAYPLSSQDGASGYVVVAAPEPPPEHEQSLIRALAHQTGVVLVNARLLAWERAARDRLANVQITVRRVAAIVARAAAPQEVFAAVAEEAARMLDAELAVMSRYDEHGTATVVGAWAASAGAQPLPVGTHMEHRIGSMHTLVFATNRPARIEHAEIGQGGADVTEHSAARVQVGVPIPLEGRLWGVLSVSSRRDDALPPETDTWLTAFTEMVAAAIANAETQAALTASRARIVAAADTERHRIERDLHDGAQQQLVTLALQLRAAKATVPADAGELAAELDRLADGLVAALGDLREIARGIHPATLAKGGLSPALASLARRSGLPVDLDVRVDVRLPEQIELAAYYVVAEALTNAARHADPTRVDVEVVAGASSLRVCVRDDGRGGADGTRGSGLVGLKDRVETLGGRISVHSPPGTGTELEIALPLTGRPGR